MFLATITRPGIRLAVSRVSQFITKPRMCYWTAENKFFDT